MCVPKTLQHVRLNRFRSVTARLCGCSRMGWVRVNFNRERFGRMLRRGKGAKSFGFKSAERTKGLRCGLAWRKSQKSKVLSLLFK